MPPTPQEPTIIYVLFRDVGGRFAFQGCFMSVAAATEALAATGAVTWRDEPRGWVSGFAHSPVPGWLYWSPSLNEIYGLAPVVVNWLVDDPRMRQAARIKLLYP